MAIAPTALMTAFIMLTSLLVAGGFSIPTSILVSDDGIISVRSVAGKGSGAFATVPIPAGMLVCQYEGEILTREEAVARGDSEYLFEMKPPRDGVSDGLYVDGESSNHVSRYINHDEHGNLMPAVGVARASSDVSISATTWRWSGPVVKLSRTTVSALSAQASEDGGSDDDSSRIEFYAARDISEGDELTFDYGEAFWAARSSDPMPGSDSRIVRIRVKRALRWLDGPLRTCRTILASLPM